MKQYKIPITWQSYEVFSVEAENLQEAVEKALKEFLTIPDDKYLQDSFEIDNILEDDYPNEEYDFHEALQKL